MPSPPLLWKFQSLCFRRETRGRLGTVLAFANASSCPIEFSSLFTCVLRDPSSGCSSSLWTSPIPFPGTVLKPSELAATPFEKGNLSAAEAATRALARAWQSFSYFSCQNSVGRSQVKRCGQSLKWTTTSAISEISKTWHLKLQAECYVWAAEAPSQLFTPAIDFYKGSEDHRNGSQENELHKSSLRSVNEEGFSKVLRRSWRRYLENAGEAEAVIADNRHCRHERQTGFGSQAKIRRLLSISVAVYFYLARPCLPILSLVLQQTIHGVTRGRAAIVVPLGLMYSSSQPDDNSEAKEKITNGSLNNKGLRLLPGACCLPHPEKEDTGGEDAYFICLDKQAIGVADGVGGWADLGVDAGQYARELMNQSLIAARQEPRGFIDPARVLERAYSNTTCKGSSTACILALSDYGLQAANLGDSGFLVLRNGRVIFKSPAQQHKFNIPFQLGCGGSDPPSAAEVFTVDVAKGDVIVAGTDGLFDNLYDVEVTSIVVHAIRSKLSPEITAHQIASLARSHAQDHNRQTPFSTAAQDAGFRFYGGKLDDVTVVVSYITAE